MAGWGKEEGTLWQGGARQRVECGRWGCAAALAFPLSSCCAPPLSSNRTIPLMIPMRCWAPMRCWIRIGRQVLDRIVNKKEKYDILIMDEIFITEQTSRCMLGSEAIKLLRPQLSGGEVIISCSGNYSEGNKGVIPQGADAVWCKPFPDFRDGSMQRQLLALFQARRAASAAAGDGPREGTLSMKV